MREDHAVLISENLHKIISHSVYHEFVNPSSFHEMFFSNENLYKLNYYSYKEDVPIFVDSHIDDNDDYYIYIIGLSRSRLSIMKKVKKIPRIVCHSGVAWEKPFRLQMNSSSCNKSMYDIFGPDENIFEVC